MERVREYLKSDELMDQEREVKPAMTSRANILGLMLHHKIIKKIQIGFQKFK